MTSLLWAAFGMTIGAALLHGALGLRSPLDRTYLSFACLMAALAAFLVLESDLYRATDVEAAVEAVRRRVVAALLANACFFVFLPSYTRAHLPRWLMPAYWLALLALFVVNLLAPYGLWFSARPELHLELFRGEIYSSVIAPPMALPQIAYVVFFVSQPVVAFACAFSMFRRGERQRALTFGAAVLVVGVHMVADFVRDAVGGSWPYLAEYGFVTWGLIMSVQLALDYRSQADRLSGAIAHVEAQSERLTSILHALRSLERNMDAPLETLQAGVSGLPCQTTLEQDQLERLIRAVGRLREFSESMPDLSAWSKSASRTL